jgi:hypothetical protein
MDVMAPSGKPEAPICWKFNADQTISRAWRGRPYPDRSRSGSISACGNWPLSGPGKPAGARSRERRERGRGNGRNPTLGPPRRTSGPSPKIPVEPRVAGWLSPSLPCRGSPRAGLGGVRADGVHAMSDDAPRRHDLGRRVFSVMRRPEVGHYYHHIAGAHLLRYAQEASWREDHRRVSNGDQVQHLSTLAMHNKPSVDFCGYWQRHLEGV